MKSCFLSVILFFLIGVLFAQTTGTLSVSAKTSSAGGKYAPDNIVAIWVEDANGNFVKTLLAFANKRIKHLNNWEASTNAKGKMYDRTDAITGATKSSHGTRTCTWDGTDYNKNLLGDGTYSLCMELTDKNSTGNYSKFSFIKGENNTVSPANIPSFSSVSLRWEEMSTANLPEFKNTQDVDIYPNPVKNVFNVEGENIDEIEVWDITGKFILRNSYSKEIDMSMYKRGIYLVHVKKENQTIIRKLIKK